MAKDVIDFRRSVRERIDPTAIHRTGTLDASNTSETIRLDIVARKVTIEVPSGLTVNISGSIDSRGSFTIQNGLSNGRKTYGAGNGEHLVKNIVIARTAGSGAITVVAVSQ